VNDSTHPRRLHLVSAPRREEPFVEPGDLVLLGTLAVVGAVPLASELLGADWSPGTLGAAALLTLLSGRELLTHVRALLRARP